MLKIMILDDEELCLEKEKKITEDYFAEQGISCMVETCQSVEWFVMGIQEEQYDIYLLDIEMPGQNGLKAAKEIRKAYPEPLIMFITNYAEYAIEAYEVNTYRYIPKMALEKRLRHAYQMALPQLLKKEEHYYIIEKKGNIEKLAYSNIYYMKKDGKYVTFVHKHGESTVRKSIANVLEELKSGEFIMIEKSYAANIRHVMKMENMELYMRNGMRIPVGSSKAKSVREAILDYWRTGKC